MVHHYPWLVPLFPAGQEPLPPGLSEEEIAMYEQTKKMTKYMTMAQESCVFKSGLSGVAGTFFLFQAVNLECSLANFIPIRRMPMPIDNCRFKGFGLGAFFSMMSTSFAYDDPLSRSDLSTRKKTTEMFKEMGRGMYRSGRSFGKVGALYAGIECVIESVS
jgi:import inner membrane translocase subunit TIM22